MADKKIPFLCGGIFFFLISGIKQGVSAREHAKGIKDEVKNEDIMDDLVLAVVGRRYSPSKAEVSQYRSCSANGSTGIPFDDKSVRDSFSDAILHDYATPHKRITEFLDKYMVGEQQRTWFAKALLDLILNDDDISENDLFYVRSDGSSVTKAELRKMTSFEFQPFVLGTIHYIVSQRYGRNKEGKATFDAWKVKEGNAYKYNGDAGARITYKITVKDCLLAEPSQDVDDGLEEDTRTDDEVIFDNIKKPLEMFASAIKAQKHQMAEQIRQNNKKADSSEDEPEYVDAEVVDDEMPSGAADASKDAKVVHQTVVNQYGDHPVHIDHVENLKL